MFNNKNTLGFYFRLQKRQHRQKKGLTKNEKILFLLLLFLLCLAAFCSCFDDSDGGSPSLIGCWHDESQHTVIEIFYDGTAIGKDFIDGDWITSKATWNLKEDGTLLLGSATYSLEFVNNNEIKLRNGNDYWVFYRADYTINDVG